MTHNIRIHSADYEHLAAGLKSFVLLKETTPPLHYGDVLHLTANAYPHPLTRWVSYILSGVGLAEDWLVIEVKP